MDWRALQFGWIELASRIIKPPEPGKLGIQRQTL